MESGLKHIAIIMDGNGRWAERRGFERLKGHIEGANALERIAKYANDTLGLPHLSLFAFSTENWKRPLDEVNGLMDLLFDYLNKEPEELLKRDVKLNFIGELDQFPERLQVEIRKAIEKTKLHKGMQLTVAVGYGGRQEILQATEKIIEQVRTGQKTLEDVESLSVESLRAYLYDPQLPDLDIIIRTGGEQRISNFYLWQAAGAYFWSTPTLWPDFDAQHLDEAIRAYERDVANVV